MGTSSFDEEGAGTKRGVKEKIKKKGGERNKQGGGGSGGENRRGGWQERNRGKGGEARG